MPTILELFKGSPQDLLVKSDKETLVEQETTGIRQVSGVERNNIDVYGSDVIRIGSRTITTTQLQKDVTGTEASGLLNQGISLISGGRVNSVAGAVDKVSSKLGIPQNLIPTKVISNSQYFGKNTGGEPDTMIILSKIRNDGKGNLVGQFLKSTGGGTPTTIGKQAVGKGIGLIKDKVREVALGGQQTVGQLTGKSLETEYSSTQKYSDVLKSEGRNIYDEGGSNSVSPTDTEPAVKFANQSTDKIDLRLVSPVYGIDRSSNENRFGTSQYAYQFNPDKPRRNEKLPSYDPTSTYSQRGSFKSPQTLRDRGFDSKSDSLNALSPSDEYSKEETEKIGLIPFWISGVEDSDKPVFFRAILSSITETVSPSWDTDNFIGNPYKFHKYSGVDRSISFTLKLYCMNDRELSVNWEKINYVSKKAYPSINREFNYVDAPFIRFRLGDIYNNKVGYVKTLSYTVDDNSTWETDVEGLLLPKFIDVQMEIEFVEWEGIEFNLYDYKYSPEALEVITEAQTQNTETQIGQTPVIERQQVNPITLTGNNNIKLPTIKGISKNGKTGISGQPKDANTGKSVSTPKEGGVDTKKTTASSFSTNERTEWENKLKTKYSAEVVNIIVGTSSEIDSDYQVAENYVGFVRDIMGSKEVLAVNIKTLSVVTSNSGGTTPIDTLKKEVKTKVDLLNSF